MSLQTLNNVYVLGGSLAGLMHALTIVTHSPTTKVMILERSPTAMLHNQGAGVVAGAETQRFFERYVRPGREIAVTSKQRLYLAKDGSTVDGSVENREQRMTSWDVLYRLLRWRADGMDAADYLDDAPDNDGPKASYLYGCTASRVEDLGTGKGVKVSWTDNSGHQQSGDCDLVIAADGASSNTRAQLIPNIERKYCGYVAFRGTVPETQLSEAATAAFSEKFAFYHAEGLQILCYLIPGENGSLERGKRLMNWLWYTNYEDGSAELDELMTDKQGKRRPITLPVGGMSESVWERQKVVARDFLPPQYAELVEKTKEPFVQAITDVICPENLFMDGKVLLVGDALAGFRPHTAASTSQGAFDALTLGELVTGHIDVQEYGKRCRNYAKRLQRQGVELGERSQFGRHPFAA